VRRRDFIKIILSSAAAWPLAASAQQPAMPVIGFLDERSSDEMGVRLRAFHEGLKETGFVDGDNVSILYRFAENQAGRLAGLAADLVQRKVAVIATPGPPWGVCRQGRHDDDPRRVHCGTGSCQPWFGGQPRKAR
jgi:ABC-type uncharacterized transport system substrate-binding protein